MFNINMKKTVLWLLVIMIVSLSIGTIMLFATGGTSSFSHEVDQEKIIELNGITDLEITSVSTPVNVVLIDGGEIRVRLYGNISTSRKDYVPELTTTVYGSSAGVKLKWPSGGVIGYFMSNLRVDVFIPSSYSENLTIKTSSARIQIDGLNLKNFEATSVSGNIGVTNTSAGELFITTSSGKGQVTSINCEELRYQSVSGDLTAQGVVTSIAKFDTSSGSYELESVKSKETSFTSIAGNLKARGLDIEKTFMESSSGRIELDGYLGDVTLETVSGRATLVYSSFSNTIFASTSSGSVRIELPSEAEFELDYSTSSGSLSNDFPTAYSHNTKRSMIGIAGNGANRISVRTVSGDLTVVKR